MDAKLPAVNNPESKYTFLIVILSKLRSNYQI